MSEGIQSHIDRLRSFGTLSREQFIEVLRFRNRDLTEYMLQEAGEVSMHRFQKGIRLWGRISFSNYCKNDCKYCGIRRSNTFVKRYRLSDEKILAYCHDAYEKGVRHFLLESGVDMNCKKEDMFQLLRQIKKHFPEGHSILEIGERNKAYYTMLRDAGAEMAIMPEGTADAMQFKHMHPGNMSLLRRKQCMWELKEMGYTAGAGFLVGTPFQTIEQVAEELLFLKQYEPAILQVRPFLPAMHTPYEKERSGNGEMVLYLVSILRLMFPGAMILADDSMDQMMRNGRIQALSAGANVLVADITPLEIGTQYGVYQNKTPLQHTSMEGWISLVEAAGYHLHM